MLNIPEFQPRLKSEASQTEEQKNAQIEEIRWKIQSKYPLPSLPTIGLPTL